MLGNRDVGVLINGTPVDDTVTPGVQERRLVIEFKEKTAPPWVMPDGKRARKRQITVFSVKRGLTWEEVKLAAKQYTSGQRLVNARLTTGIKCSVMPAPKTKGCKKLKNC
jgi:hypothetical protein